MRNVNSPPLMVRPDTPAAPAALPHLTADEIQDLDRRFATAPAREIIRWAVDTFGAHLALTTSMTDAVLIDVATSVDPAIEVVFIDTGYHFPETLQTLEEVRKRYGLNLRMMTVAPHAPELWAADPENCCSAVKVGQLDRALMAKAAWMSGLRRSDAPLRANAAVVGHDLRGLVKLNPLAAWTDDDVARYIEENNVPVNPLVAHGYTSIGCMPCTRPTVPGEDGRAGRWSGSAKTECGLHV